MKILYHIIISGGYMKKTTYLVMFILALLLLYPGFVASEMVVNTYSTSRDFAVIPGNDIIKMCACSGGNDTFKVLNTGTYPAVFAIEIDNPSAVLSANSFELLPGQSKDIMLAFNAACITGKSRLAIMISSNLGVQKRIEKHFTIDQCTNIELWLSNDNQTLLSCQDATFTLFVKNSGSFEDNYQIKGGDASSVNPSYFTLQPNQVAQVSVRSKNGCTKYGDKELSITVHSEKNNQVAKIKGRYSIVKDFDYKIMVDSLEDTGNMSYRQSVDACNKVYFQEFPITVTNLGVDNNFTIEARRMPGFMSIKGIDDSENKFMLAKGQSKTFYINTDLHEFNKEVKGYDFELSFKPALGDAKTKNLRINTKQCYDHSVEIMTDTVLNEPNGLNNPNDEIKSSSQSQGINKENPLKICSGEIYEYNVRINNNGIFDESLMLKLENNPEWITLSKDQIILAPGESKDLVLKIRASESNELYSIKASATLRNGLYAYDTVWIKAYSMHECHLIEFQKADFRINFDDKFIEVPIRNSGIMPSNYKVSLERTEMFSLSDDLLKISQGNNAVVRININQDNKSEGTYYANLTITDTISDSSYYKPVKVVLKDKSSIRKGFEFLAFGNACRQFSLIEVFAIIIICILIILFMIKGPHYPYKISNRIKQKMPILIVLFFILLIGLVFVLTFAGLPKMPDEVYELNSDFKALRFETLQDNKMTLDLNTFFKDPDNNMLSYNVTEMDGITSKIRDNSRLVLYPDLGFSGERKFTITAYDNQGGSIDSPEMTIVVVPKKQKSGTQIYDAYCWYINLAIFAIVLILIFLLVVVKQKKRTRK